MLARLRISRSGARERLSRLVRLVVVGAALLAVTTAAACGGDDDSGSADGQGGGGGTFVLTNLSDPDPIDPALVSHTMSRTLVRNVYEPLVYYELGTTELVPVLATEWEVSDDGLEYTFQLRQGVTFHDGTSFDAEDVKATIERDLELTSGVGGSYLQDVKEITVVDPDTVTIALNRPYAFFLGSLAKIPIASAQDIEQQAGTDNAQTWFKDNANGTGPYTLDQYVRGTQYTLLRNEEYWQEAPENALDRVVVRPIGDSATQAQLISRGEVNMGSWMAFRDMIQASEAEGNELFDFRSPMTLIGALNGSRPPLDDVRVRRAILAAFPYDRLREFYQGFAQPPQHVLSPTYPGAAEFPELQQDLDEARRLLAEAGHPDGGFKLRYVAVEGLEDERQAGLLLQDALAQLGIELEIDVLPFGTFFEQAQEPETAPDISPGYEAPETNDPFEWFRKLFACDGFLNFSHFCSEELDQLIDQAQTSTSESERAELLQQAQQLIADNAFAVPMSNFDGLYVGADWIGGFEHDITDLLYVPKFFGMTRE